jgi:hypothetical protein
VYSDLTAFGIRLLDDYARARWRAISRGLTLVVAGQLVLGLLGLAALALAGLAGPGAPLSDLPRQLDLQARPVLMALTLVGAVGFLAYFLVLAGQVRCLAHLPENHPGKDLLLGSLFGTLAGPVLSGAAPFLGADLYPPLNQELERLGWPQAGTVLQVGAGALGLLGLFLFARFLQVVAYSCQDEGLAAKVEHHLLGGCVLLGGSVGLTFFAGQLAVPGLALLGLAAGWLACFLWHVTLVSATRRRLDRALRSMWGGKTGQHRVDGQSQAKPYTGLHYFYTARLP